MAHFKELNLTQNCQNFLETSDSSKITLTMCVLILVEEFLGFCPCWWEVMKKFKDLSQKSYLEALNPCQIIKFLFAITFNGFFSDRVKYQTRILKQTKSLFSLKIFRLVA